MSWCLGSSTMCYTQSKCKLGKVSYWVPRPPDGNKAAVRANRQATTPRQPEPPL